MKNLLLITAITSIVGCSSYETRVADYIEEAHPVCVTISSTEDEYKRCLSAYIQDRERSRASSRRAMAAALQGAGDYCRGGKTVGPNNVYVNNC